VVTERAWAIPSPLPVPQRTELDVWDHMAREVIQYPEDFFEQRFWEGGNVP